MNSLSFSSEESPEELFGKLLLTIEFASPPPQWEEEFYKEGEFYPYVWIHSTDEDIEQIQEKDIIVIPHKEITLTTSYPFHEYFFKKIRSQNGFSRAHLLREISIWYEKLCNENPLPGHDISDLDICEIQVFESTDGNIIGYIEIDS